MTFKECGSGTLNTVAWVSYPNFSVKDENVFYIAAL